MVDHQALAEAPPEPDQEPDWPGTPLQAPEPDAEPGEERDPPDPDHEPPWPP